MALPVIPSAGLPRPTQTVQENSLDSRDSRIMPVLFATTTDAASDLSDIFKNSNTSMIYEIKMISGLPETGALR